MGFCSLFGVLYHLTLSCACNCTFIITYLDTNSNPTSYLLLRLCSRREKMLSRRQWATKHGLKGHESRKLAVPFGEVHPKLSIDDDVEGFLLAPRRVMRCLRIKSPNRSTQDLKDKLPEWSKGTALSNPIYLGRMRYPLALLRGFKPHTCHLLFGLAGVLRNFSRSPRGKRFCFGSDPY